MTTTTTERETVTLDPCAVCAADGAYRTSCSGQVRAECADYCGEVTRWLPTRAEAMVRWNKTQRGHHVEMRRHAAACGEA